MLVSSPATADDISAFYGSVPCTIKAVCVRRDGEPVLVVGLAIEKRRAKFFSENKMTGKELRSKTTWKAVKAAMALVKKNLTPVVAVAESVEGHKNLSRLGFEHVFDEVYQWRS